MLSRFLLKKVKLERVLQMCIPSWELTYPLKAVHFEDDFPFPVWWDMSVPRRVNVHVHFTNFHFYQQQQCLEGLRQKTFSKGPDDWNSWRNTVPGVYIYPLEGFPIKGGMTLPNIYVIMYLAILLVTFFGMVKNVTLSRGEKWPPTIGMKKGTAWITWVLVFIVKKITPPLSQISGCFFFRFCSGFKFRRLFFGLPSPNVILKTSCGRFSNETLLQGLGFGFFRT